MLIEIVLSHPLCLHWSAAADPVKLKIYKHAVKDAAACCDDITCLFI